MEEEPIVERIYRADPENRNRAKVDERKSSTAVKVPSRNRCSILFSIQTDEGYREFYTDGINENAELWVFETESVDSRVTEYVYSIDTEKARERFNLFMDGETEGFLMLKEEEIRDLFELSE